jgi:hypothetical protein
LPLHSNNFKHNLWGFEIPEDLATNTPNLLHVGLFISLDVIEITLTQGILSKHANTRYLATSSNPCEVLANGDPFAFASTIVTYKYLG